MARKPLAKYNNTSIMAAFGLILNMLIEEIEAHDPKTRKRILGKLIEAAARLGEPDYQGVDEIRAILAGFETLLRSANNQDNKTHPQLQ